MKTSIISRFALISFIVVLLSIVDHVDAKWGVSRTEVPLPTHRWFSSSPEVFPRGGDQSPASTDFDTTPSSSSTVDSGADEPSLDEKVYAAMQKLGMSPPTNEDIDEGECKDGVCSMADQDSQDPSTASAMTQSSQDPHVIADSIAQDMNVDSRLAMAAIGATSTFGEENQRIYNDQAARDMIQYELDLIESIPSDSPNVQKLVEEGFDLFFSRRALAFAENNMDDARAILLADQIDEDEDDAADAEKSEEAVKTLDIVEVKADFDPTALPTTPKATPSVTDTPSASAPKPAPKESVVFEATTAQIQELVLESPVPVLLDIYADWCGPCKVLGPALEEMAVKSGGIFRLVKVNSDNERPVSGALEVTALPTVFGVKDGKVVHMFQGMPKSEEMMKNFMMGLFGAAPFSPSVTAEQSKKYKELTDKLMKTAGAACFSFSARERLTDRITAKLDDLVQDDSVADVEGAANLLRTFMNNIVKNPYEQKYRKVNLENKLIMAKIGTNPNALAVLKSVGFSRSGSEMILGKGKRIINVAPPAVARDCIDKWIQKNRSEMAAAARKRKDEADRAKLQAKMEASGDDKDEMDEKADEHGDTSTTCLLRLRLDGKKKIHEVTLGENDPLSAILEALNVDASSEVVQITCAAKRLVVKSSETEKMQKSLKDHGLTPSASIVVKVGSSSTTASSSSSLKERASAKAKKKGTHTMQSVGIYSKDDNSKTELIDGGGGVWYEHDVSDDNEEAKNEGAVGDSLEDNDAHEEGFQDKEAEEES